MPIYSNYFAALAAVWIAALTSAANAEVAQSTALLPKTGEKAREGFPSCSSAPASGQQILNAIEKGLDAYFGAPVGTATLGALSENSKNRLQVALGIHNGKANCATMCVVVPKNTIVYGKDGYHKGEMVVSNVGVADGNDAQNTPGLFQGVFPNGTLRVPVAWFGMPTESYQEGSNSKLVCTEVRNWSHNIPRQFTYKLNYGTPDSTFQ